MTADEELKQLWERSVNRKAVLCWATVTSVNEEEQTCNAVGVADDTEYYDIQLGAGAATVYPTVGAVCLIGLLEKSSSDAFLIAASAIDRIEVTAATCITLNGGKNGGLVNIGVLTEKINALVDKFNSHTHPVNTTGTATAQTGMARAVMSKADRLNKDDYEDILITH